MNTKPLLQRRSNNPILQDSDIPWDCMSVFNAGISKWNGQYVMLFRTDSGPKDAPIPALTRIGLAHSKDGYTWEIEKEPVFDRDKIRVWLKDQYEERFGSEEIVRVYDPRITVIDGEAYFCFAFDTEHGVRGGIAKTTDQNLRSWELLHLSLPENRNMVLFPERVNGKLVRLDRPFPLYFNGGKESFDIWMSNSSNGTEWGDHRLLLASEEVPFANAKIGPGAPPIKTERGWLTTFHAVEINNEKPLNAWSPHPWTKEYIAGLMLLDLENPAKVIGMCREPLLRAETEYELDGFRGGVIFPGGFLLEDDGTVKMYYGAADTVVGLAEGKLEDLLNAIELF
ncbi:glycoside hydrolase family 130 protein [Coraliomargarita parva]|uniref:glycoside hydrolase family 130 protein n=1 Tax=Coraliomargarita parva TaxID=3014050 RepID=UPI0022B4D315|nr:glycoside hydrolase family 130 protein [Coraliomargarita parva]